MHPLCHNALSHILTLAVGARWFGHEHFHAQVPAARRRGPHLSDIIAGHRGDPDSHGAATPGQTRARTDLPHRDQDLKSPLCVCRTPDVLCSRATSWTSCLHFNHSTLNAQQRELPPPCALCNTAHSPSVTGAMPVAAHLHRSHFPSRDSDGSRLHVTC